MIRTYLVWYVSEWHMSSSVEVYQAGDTWACNAWLCDECYQGLSVKPEVLTVANWAERPCGRCSSPGEHFVIGLPFKDLMTVPVMLKAWLENRLPRRVEVKTVPMMIDAYGYVMVSSYRVYPFSTRNPKPPHLETVETIRLRPCAIDHACYWAAYSETANVFFIGQFSEVEQAADTLHRLFDPSDNAKKAMAELGIQPASVYGEES